VKANGTWRNCHWNAATICRLHDLEAVAQLLRGFPFWFVEGAYFRSEVLA
jgi:hypothetical protein